MPEPNGTQNKNTWIVNDKTRAAFWADAARLGFDHETVHTILSVTTMKDFTGTRAEAVGQLAKARQKLDAEANVAATQAAEPPAEPESPPADETFNPGPPPAAPSPELPADIGAPAPTQAAPLDTAYEYADALSRMPESPCLAFTRINTPAGFTWSVTIRAGMPEAVENEAMRSIFRQITHFERGAQAASWLAIADGRDTVVGGLKPRNGEPPQAPQPSAAQLPPQAGSGGGSPPQATGEVLTFKIASFDVTTSNGKTSWKVKGGRFPKHGVTMWPEPVIAAGLDPDNLKIESIAGWNATYILNDEGNPKKIVKLEAA